MPKIIDDDKTRATLEALRDVVSAKIPTARWEGGRIFLNEFGEEVFLPIGTPRENGGFVGPLTFLGDGMRNTAGWVREVVVTNPIEGAV